MNKDDVNQSYQHVKYGSVTASDLPEECKVYVVHQSNGEDFVIRGTDIDVILNSKSQFVRLRNGEVINKAFTIDIKFDEETTKNNFMKLSDEERKAILEPLLSKRLTS